MSEQSVAGTGAPVPPQEQPTKSAPSAPPGVMGLDVAEAEFERFAAAMDLDIDTERMSEDDLKGFEDNKRVFLKALIDGHLVVNDNGEPELTTRTLPDNITLTFREPEGESFMSMDAKKKNQDFRKLYGVMAHMCRVHQGVFTKMKNRDLKICQAVMTLFLA